jgi:hypothetical protein
MAQERNASIHYDARLAARIPARATAVLNVGCGDGFPAARLARQIPGWPPPASTPPCPTGHGPGSRTRR